MMNEKRLSEHFLLKEIACYCGCGFDSVDMDLIYALEEFRVILSNYTGVDTPITVTQKGGCRCENGNKAAGGAPKSKHLLGEAADIKVKGVNPKVVADLAESVERFKNGGIGRYPTFTHVDVRKGRARW